MKVLSQNAVAVCIDLQEKLFPTIHNNMQLEQKVITLISGLNTLKVPIVITEQYPKGLGLTILPIKNLISSRVIEKKTFSCCGSEEFNETLKALSKKIIVLFGIESHVCVLQTAVDLKAQGYIVFVVVDCISSREEMDKEIAIHRFDREGVFLTTVESLLFELCETSEHKSFKVISKLVK